MLTFSELLNPLRTDLIFLLVFSIQLKILYFGDVQIRESEFFELFNQFFFCVKKMEKNGGASMAPLGN